MVVGLFAVIAALLRTADTGVYFRLADQVAMVLLGLFIAGGVLLLGPAAGAGRRRGHRGAQHR